MDGDQAPGSPQQAAAVLRSLVEQVRVLTEERGVLSQQLHNLAHQQVQQQPEQAQQQQMADGLATLPALLQTLTAAVGERNKPSLVDTRGLGKPFGFDNKDDNFHRWATKTQRFVASVFGEASVLLDWVVDLDQPTDSDAVEFAWQNTIANVG